MNWIRANVFLSGWLAALVIGSLLLGLFASSSCRQYSAARSSYRAAVERIDFLEKQKPYPNEQNLQAKQEMIEEYGLEVEALRKELASYQRDLAVVSSTEFQTDLKQRIDRIKSKAEQSQVELPENFSFAMNRYTGTLPIAEACPMLDLQLESLDYLASLLVEKQVVSIDGFKRSTLPQEVAGSTAAKDLAKNTEKAAANEASAIEQRSEVEISFTSEQEVLVEVLNALSNASSEKFFQVIRLLRIENEVLQGPERGSEESSSNTSNQRRQGKSSDELAANASADTVEPLSSDARFLFGEELIRCHLKVELLRFSPEGSIAQSSRGSRGTQQSK